MVVKDFVFRQNWKKNFFAIFDPTCWTHILAPKGPNKEPLRQYFNQERQKLYYYQLRDFKNG